jgi:hypothetical protein
MSLNSCISSCGMILCLLAFLCCHPVSAQSRIACSSVDGGRQYCSCFTADSVVLVRELSRSKCIQEKTWGFDRHGVWVSRGCRAEFALHVADGYRPDPERLQVLPCGSDNGRRQWCRIESDSQVRLLRQKAGGKCTEGQSWGIGTGSVWVDYGCQADFEIRSRHY